TSVNQQTVTLTIPKYIIQSGDAEAVSNPSLVGAMRSPTISTTTSGVQVNYGSATSTVMYSINGASILRTEDGVVTTIASSTDQLVPSTIDTDLANTEKTTMAVTFHLIFTSGYAAAARSRTTVSSLA